MNVGPFWFAFLLQEIPETLPESPVPGGIAAVVRFLFHVPQWIQIGGAVVAVLAGIWSVVLVWTRRGELWAWIRSRPRGWQIGLGIAAATVAIVAAGFGGAGWNYVQHENEFCTGCHIMGPAFQRFTDSEHAELSCHDCHRQSMFASARQLYLWVLERPEEIGPHAPVPDAICAECHIRERPDSLWQRVAATAGHRLHLESDTTALADVMCVTCHGEEVHRFVPADRTCGQAGCHAEETTRIVLGAMAGQTGFHCVACHEFTAAVSEAVALDTAAAALVPRQSQCFSCHDMERLMGGFDAAADPHQAVCGACHDPHRQERPRAAFATCTESGCHAAPDTLTPFHRGIATAVLEDCATCHAAHSWTVDGQECSACHPDVAASGPLEPRAPTLSLDRPRIPTPTFRAAEAPNAGRGPDPGRDRDATGPAKGRWTAVPGAAPDGLASSHQERPFRHADHRGVACSRCHSSRESHGRVTVTSPGGCFACHHASAPAARADCAACHRASGPAGARSVPVELRLSIREETRARALPFDHARHVEVACRDCHAGSRLEPTSSCTDCHAKHHRTEAACAACHSEKPSESAHSIAVHEAASCGGSGCHAEAAAGPGRLAYGALPRTRSFCLSCHQDQTDHEPGGRCAGCHQVREAAAARGDG